MANATDLIPSRDNLRRIPGVFLSPGATFKAIKQSISKADYIIPVVLILVVGLGTRVVIAPLEHDRQISALEQRTGLSDDDRAEIIGRLDSWFEMGSEPVGYAIGLAANVAWLAVQAGILMFMAVVVLGGTGKFGSALVVVCYAQLINVLAAMLKIPLIVYKQSLNVDTSLALLLPNSVDSSLLYRFFHRLDLFTIWMIWVMGIGLATMFDVESRRVNRLLFTSWGMLMLALAWLVDGRLLA